ncbi:MAG: DUF6265 family protein [bacterium]
MTRFAALLALAVGAAASLASQAPLLSAAPLPSGAAPPFSAAAPPASATLARVSWLAGCWELALPGRTVEENWMAPRGGCMIGVGRSVRGDSLFESEFVLLREQDGRLAYEAHPSGQPSAVFLSGDVTDSSVVFENPAHDYPQRVGYRRVGADSLLAWIDGTVRGQSRRVDFPLRRVRCPGP